MKTFEDEVKAMRSIFKVLDKLPDEDSRTRVLKYVTEAECDRHAMVEAPVITGIACVEKERQAQLD